MIRLGGNWGIPERPCPLQLSSSVLTAIGASREGRCATGRATVKTDRMSWIARLYPTAATSTVTTKPAVSLKTSCVTGRETAPTARTRRSVVGDDGSRLKYPSRRVSHQIPFFPSGLSVCGSHQYRCASGQCVSEGVRCDGYPDCRDHSDEADCARPPRCPAELRCPNSHECLQKEWLCDGEDDCKDGSDEKVKTRK